MLNIHTAHPLPKTKQMTYTNTCSSEDDARQRVSSFVSNDQQESIRYYDQLLKTWTWPKVSSYASKNFLRRLQWPSAHHSTLRNISWTDAKKKINRCTLPGMDITSNAIAEHESTAEEGLALIYPLVSIIDMGLLWNGKISRQFTRYRGHKRDPDQWTATYTGSWEVSNPWYQIRHAMRLAHSSHLKPNKLGDKKIFAYEKNSSFVSTVRRARMA